MANTRILVQEFECFDPETLKDAVSLLDRYGSDAKVIAGGTDLLVQMKQETICPRYLINVRKIPELNRIVENGKTRIGAAVVLSELLNFCMRDARYAALSEAIRSLGKVQVRNMGTIGGNLCNASPAADSAPPLLVLDATVRVVGPEGERVLPLAGFFRGVNVTALAPNEILKEIEIPDIPEGLGAAFMKVGRVSEDISKVSAAAAVVRKGKNCESCRVALGAVASVPMRVEEAEKILIGKGADVPIIDQVARRAAKQIRPITDVRSTAEYRKQLAFVLLRDALWEAWLRAGGKRT
jgi:carbon-monoxide dehydrogenase medium subunit